MSTATFAYTRRFFAEEEVIISSCNNCLRPVGESGNEVELEALEQRHACIVKAIAPGEKH